MSLKKESYGVISGPLGNHIIESSSPVAQKFGFLNICIEIQESVMLLKNSCFELSVIRLWKCIQFLASAFLWTVALVIFSRSAYRFQLHHHKMKGLIILRVFVYAKIITVVSRSFHKM